MKKEDLFKEDFLKQFKSGEELERFLICTLTPKALQKVFTQERGRKIY